jgi:hypothetical protein
MVPNILGLIAGKMAQRLSTSLSWGGRGPAVQLYAFLGNDAESIGFCRPLTRLHYGMDAFPDKVNCGRCVREGM